MRHAHPIEDHHRVVGQAHHAVREQHAIHRLLHPRVVVPGDQGGFGVELRDPDLEVLRVELGSAIGGEVSVAQASGISPAARDPGQLVHPPDLMRQTLVPESVRCQIENATHHLAAQDGRERRVVAHVQRAVVAIVAAEQLVAAIATHRNLHVAARQRGEMVETRAERVRRFVEVIHQRGQQRQQVAADSVGVMNRAVAVGHGTSSRTLVEPAVRQAH